VVIAQFESLLQAQAWADADPYVAAGVYTRVQVRRSARSCRERGTDRADA
jgi:uncharacterized protein YciI